MFLFYCSFALTRSQCFLKTVVQQSYVRQDAVRNLVSAVQIVPIVELDVCPLAITSLGVMHQTLVLPELVAVPNLAFVDLDQIVRDTACSNLEADR